MTVLHQWYTNRSLRTSDHVSNVHCIFMTVLVQYQQRWCHLVPPHFLSSLLLLLLFHLTHIFLRSLLCEGMVCEKGIQILLTTVGAFAAFGLMTVAIGTDYWLYSRALICNSTANVTQDDPHNKDKKDPGALTHSGLWRICCLEGREETFDL